LGARTLAGNAQRIQVDPRALEIIIHNCLHKIQKQIKISSSEKGDEILIFKGALFSINL